MTGAGAGKQMKGRAWPWLTAIVVISAAIRIALGRHVIAPWIMGRRLDGGPLGAEVPA